MDYKKLIIVAIVLLIIWGSFLWYLIAYGEAVKDSPCVVCAKKYRANCLCTKVDNPASILQVDYEGNIVER